MAKRGRSSCKASGGISGLIEEEEEEKERCLSGRWAKVN